VNSGDACLVAPVFGPQQLPAIEHDIVIAFARVGKAESFACALLIMQQLAGFGIGQRDVGKDQLLGREAAGVVGIMAGARAEKGHLKTQRLLVRRFQPAGDIPPLGAEFRVRAEVAREAQRTSRQHRGERRRARQRRPGSHQQSRHRGQSRPSAQRQQLAPHRQWRLARGRMHVPFQIVHFPFAHISLTSHRAPP
jgi:hypothetical protein